jgi:hypothetical protein
MGELQPSYWWQIAVLLTPGGVSFTNALLLLRNETAHGIGQLIIVLQNDVSCKSMAGRCSQ